ncbi:MAG: PASTA domain-containing protein, partial [Rhodoglobus sp.]
GVSGGLLRHVIMRSTVAVINAKYGGGAFPEPSAALLTGSGLEVPDVRGLTPEAAKALLVGLGFGYEDAGQIDSEVPAGKVAATDPAPGTQSAKATIIKVYTSKGNKVAFPDVVEDGKSNTFPDAQGILNGQGYNQVSEVCVALPVGTLPGDERIDKVSGSDPAPGAFVMPNTKVKLTVTKLACP